MSAKSVTYKYDTNPDTTLQQTKVNKESNNSDGPETIKKSKKEQLLLVMGDFNSKIGQIRQDTIVGDNGLSYRNDKRTISRNLHRIDYGFQYVCSLVFSKITYMVIFSEQRGQNCMYVHLCQQDT